MCLLLNHNYSLTHIGFRTMDYTASNWCQFVLLKKLLVLYQYQLSEDKQCPTPFNSRKKKKKRILLGGRERRNQGSKFTNASFGGKYIDKIVHLNYTHDIYLLESLNEYSPSFGRTV